MEGNNKIKIISDGTYQGSKVIVNGKIISCVEKLDLVIEPYNQVSARLTVHLIECDVEAKDIKLLLSVFSKEKAISQLENMLKELKEG